MDKFILIISLFTLGWNLFQQIKIDKLKNKLEKDVITHKIQFENEYKIYIQIWESLVDLKNKTYNLNPQIELIPDENCILKYKIQKLNYLMNHILNV